jgi:hypothetical protein
MSDDINAVALPALYTGEAAEVHGPSAGQWAGQIVKIRSQRGTRWTVELTDGRRMNVPPQALRRTDRPFVSELPPAPVLEVAAVVTVAPPTGNPQDWPYQPDQRFVVIKVSEQTVTVVKIGGDNGRSWRVPPRACTPVPAEHL